MPSFDRLNFLELIKGMFLQIAKKLAILSRNVKNELELYPIALSLLNRRGLEGFLANNINPHTPVAQKVADKVVFRRFKGEGVEFF